MHLIEVKIIGVGLAVGGVISLINGNYETAGFLFLLAFVYGFISCAE